MSYYSLHNHTQFSNSRLLDCIIKEDDLISKAHELGLLGVAITDHEILSSHLRAQKFLLKKQKENPNDETWQNFKLILGNEIYLCKNDLRENYEKGDIFYHFILLALDEIGHLQLQELSTRAFEHAWVMNMLRVPTYYRDIEEIIGVNPGHVWASTACLGGQFAKKLAEGDNVSALEFINWCKKNFGDCFSLEIQPSNNQDQILVNKKIIEFSNTYNQPYIITTDSHYLEKEDINIHSAYLNSKGGDRETATFYSATYLMDSVEIKTYLNKYLSEKQIQDGLDFTKVIGNKVKNYSLLKPIELPYIPLEILEPSYEMKLKAQTLNMTNLLFFMESQEQADRQLSVKIAKALFDQENITQRHFDRVEKELGITKVSSEKMNLSWSKYLLQVSDYVNIYWNEGDSIVGAGRGSAVSFYICYLLGITQVDPMREKVPLKEWRFMNPERASILDIDIDIPSNRRGKCISALKNKYGELRVVEVSTFGTEKAKSAIKTAARGLGIDIDEATYLSSFIKSDRGIQQSLSQTFYGDEENDIPPNIKFRELMKGKYNKVWEIAQRIEGLVNRIGKHSGGVIIVEDNIVKSCATMCTNNIETVTQYDLHDAEEAGLIKIDLLAIETLDRIRTCLELLIQYKYIIQEATLKETYEKVIGIYNINRDNPEMWKMVHENKIISLFQMEQGSGIQAISLLKPTSVEELATINSVMRLMASEKGSEQPLSKFSRFKNQPFLWEEEMILNGLTEEERKLIHSYLDYEYGICATQEDLMAMVQDPLIGGFNLAWADRARKSIAKKHPKEFDALTIEFFQNAKDKNLSQALTNYVWNVLFKTQRG